jgi:hypothetical protein
MSGIIRPQIEQPLAAVEQINSSWASKAVLICVKQSWIG